jgi:hypothetical protein
VLDPLPQPYIADTPYQANSYAMQKGQISAIMFSFQSNATYDISKSSARIESML